MNVICFHDPDEINGCFSNWYLSDFTVDGTKFSSMEQYMMYRKALCFDDTAAAEQILAADDPSEIKRLGRLVRRYDDNYWNGVRQIIVYEGLIAKFSQNEELKEKLLGTGDAIMAECAVGDRIWGIGRSMTDPARLDRAQWLGRNLLGYSLMLVRDHLKR